MTTPSELSRLLSDHKQANRMGDKRLADLANDYADVPLLSRSTIRNWSNGETRVVRNWRQLAAISAALRLSPAETNELLAAGRCPDLDELAATVTDESDRRYLRAWADTSAAATAADAAIANVANGDTARPLGDATVSRGGSAPAPTEVDPTPVGVTRRLAPIAALVAIAAIAALVLWPRADSPDQVAGQTQVAETSEPTGESEPGRILDDVAPVSEISGPPNGAIIGPTALASGVAEHPVGISHIEAILARVDSPVYWNEDLGVWQEEWRVFVIPVTPRGATKVDWQYAIGDDVPLPAGQYRLRTWAQAMSGRGDPVGPLVEFTVAESLADPTDPQIAAAIDQLANPVPNPRRRAEEAETLPKVRVKSPVNGQLLPSTQFRILVVAEYEAGLQSVSIELEHLDSADYWNFDANQWQSTPTRLVNTHPVDSALTRDEIEIYLPGSAARNGDFRITARGVGVDGATYGPGTSIVFGADL